LDDGRYLGCVTPKEAPALLEQEPCSLAFLKSGTKSKRLAFFLRDTDSLMLIGKKFNLRDFIPKGYSFLEHLGGSGCPDRWQGVDGDEHHFEGHRVWSHVPSRRTPGRPLLEGLSAA
jgi:hypothetical protein